MKKLLVSILLMAMSLTLFVGCGGSDNADTGNASKENSSDEIQTEVSKEKVEFIGENDSVTYETDYVTITLVGTPGSGTVDLTITNKTDHTIGIYPDEWWINGYKLKPYGSYGYISIDAGNTAEEVMTMPLFTTERMGISNVGEVRMNYVLHDDSNGDVLGPILEEAIIGYKTDNYADMDVELVSNVTEIGTWNDVTFYACCTEGTLESGILYIYVENNGTQDIQFYMEDEAGSVDVRDTFSGVVRAGEKYISGIYHTSDMVAGQNAVLYLTVANSDNVTDVYESGIKLSWTVE